MKFRNCTKSGKANAEIFSELAWNIISESDNIFQIRVVVFDLNSEFRIFFRGQFGVFGQFQKKFRAHSDNYEFFPGITN